MGESASHRRTLLTVGAVALRASLSLRATRQDNRLR
jgi:hypothetical protein